MSTSAKTTSKAKQPRWIAERTLERLDAVGGRVVVRIGRPEPYPESSHGDWQCPFEIVGLGDDTIHFGRSIDSMGALQNTLSGIRAILKRGDVPLRWEFMEENHSGFSRNVEWGFGLALEQRFERMILCEVEKLCHEPHDCLTDVGLRLALLEAKHGTHGLVESAKRVLAEAREANEAASATSKAKRSRWIAARTLVRTNFYENKVVVRIGRPEMAPTGTAWRCPFGIHGFLDDIKDFGFGIDSIHALQNALEGIRGVLLASGIPLRWKVMRETDTGFHMTVPMSFGVAFEQRIEKMMSDELAERDRISCERNEAWEARHKARREARKKP